MGSFDNFLYFAIDGLSGFFTHGAAGIGHAAIEKHRSSALLRGEWPQHFTHAKGGDHLLSEIRGSLQIVRGSGGNAVEDRPLPPIAPQAGVYYNLVK